MHQQRHFGGNFDNEDLQLSDDEQDDTEKEAILLIESQ